MDQTTLHHLMPDLLRIYEYFHDLTEAELLSLSPGDIRGLSKLIAQKQSDEVDQLRLRLRREQSRPPQHEPYSLESR